MAALLLALEIFAGRVVLSFLQNWLTPPAVPSLRLPIPLRYVPGVKQPVEAVCRAFFFIGAKCGFDLGFVLGLVVAFFLCACWWSFTAHLRRRERIQLRSERRNAIESRRQRHNHENTCRCGACRSPSRYHRHHLERHSSCEDYRYHR